nr:uncharacterized protein LOC127493703 isoform X2 [Oryctolagus cuniculus]
MTPLGALGGDDDACTAARLPTALPGETQAATRPPRSCCFLQAQPAEAAPGPCPLPGLCAGAPPRLLPRIFPHLAQVLPPGLPAGCPQGSCHAAHAWASWRVTPALRAVDDCGPTHPAPGGCCLVDRIPPPPPARHQTLSPHVLIFWK